MKPDLQQELKYVEYENISIPVIYEKNESLPIVSAQIIFKNAGSIEDGNKNPISKMSARILNEGTKTLGSVEFAKELELRAISLFASSDKECFYFSINSLKENFFYAQTALCELLQEPNFNEESLRKIKLTMQGDILNKENDYDYVASNALNKLLYKNSPLANESLGTKERIENITLNDMKNFLITHLDIANVVFVLGGDINFNEAKDFVLNVARFLARAKPKQTKFYETSNLKEMKVIIKPTEQAYIYFGSPIFLAYNDKEAYKAKVASFILGQGGFGSRLLEEIRVKKGLAYSAYGRIILSLFYSSFTGFLQTKNESWEQAVQIVKDVLKDFVENGVSKTELKKAKKFILGSEPLRAESLSDRLSRAFGEYYKGFELGYFQKELKDIKDLSLEDLNKFIKSHKEIANLSFAIVKAKNAGKG